MTNNELITELLKYDGWVKFEGCGIENWSNPTTEPTLYRYLTDMNILHRIVVKVVNEAKEMLHKSDDVLWDLAEVRGDVISTMLTNPNPQGEHLQLAEAIVNAIRYISANKSV